MFVNKNIFEGRREVLVVTLMVVLVATVMIMTANADTREERETLTTTRNVTVNPSTMLSPKELWDISRICDFTYGPDTTECNIIPNCVLNRGDFIKQTKNCFATASQEIRENGSTNITATECLSYIEHLIPAD